MNNFNSHNKATKSESTSLLSTTDTVVTECVNENMLPKFQMQHMELLADRIKDYLHDDSTSLRIETAQMILASNLYTVNLYLKSSRSHQIAPSELSQLPISELYRRGSVLLYQKIRQAERLLALAKKSKLQTLNEAYNETLQAGIALFFTSYQPQFEAHETPAFIDYPLALAPDGLSGIEYITAYLKALCAENLFCKRFSVKSIHGVLYGYDKNYPLLLFNIFEQILTNALGTILLKKDILSLEIEKQDLPLLETLFQEKTEQEIRSILQSAVYHLFHELAISGSSLKAYIIKNLPHLAVKIRFYTEINKLQFLFVPKRVSPSIPAIRFHMGEKMDNEQYRDIIDEIQNCRHLEDKIHIIQQTIKSLADLEDVLRDADLTERELPQILCLLNDTELAVLLKRNSAMKEIDAIHFSENELKLQRSLQAHLASLPQKRQTKIGELKKQITEF